MKLRQMATAFIKNDGRFIMMKKTNSKLFDFKTQVFAPRAVLDGGGCASYEH